MPETEDTRTSPTTAPSLLTSLRALIPSGEQSLADTLELIKTQAEMLRSLAGASEPSDFPEAFITHLPSVRLEETDLPLHGYTFWDGEKNQWVIRRSSSDTKAERRFTLLHEFAHILWHRSEYILFPGLETPTRKRFAEHAADMFAQAVLMPENRRAGSSSLQRQFQEQPDEGRSDAPSGTLLAGGWRRLSIWSACRPTSVLDAASGSS